MPFTDDKEDINAPLPRMSRESALTWAKEYTSYLGTVAAVDIDRATEVTHYEDCVGEGDEVAEDGRFSLFYYVFAEVPTEQQTDVVRKLKSRLAKEGFEVTGYREYQDSRYTATFSARHEKDGYSVMSDPGKPHKGAPSSMSFGVRTLCMLPPGVKQQQF
ncbi:hypothetical protein [Streptomyces sp. NPDC051569]|uniref:hypothetical protein n=1 Tax=Streptomyces sp. NPDC051569 TaxID=3365661 RepID=UPI0037914BDB